MVSNLEQEFRKKDIYARLDKDFYIPVPLVREYNAYIAGYRDPVEKYYNRYVSLLKKTMGNIDAHIRNCTIPSASSLDDVLLQAFTDAIYEE